MKNKIYVSIFILVSLVLTALTLSSCDNALKFKNDGTTGNLIDEKNGRYYIYCGSYLKAAEINAKVYAKDDGKPQEKLHEIIGVDPAQWLSENIDLGIALVFREKSVEEPTLENFGAEIIHITMTQEVTLSIGSLTDKADVDAIVSDYVNNEEVPLPEYINEDVTLYFQSEKYKGIYYVLQYFVDDKNVSYLYDRWTKRCVICSVNIFG